LKGILRIFYKIGRRSFLTLKEDGDNETFYMHVLRFYLPRIAKENWIATALVWAYLLCRVLNGAIKNQKMYSSGLIIAKEINWFKTSGNYGMYLNLVVMHIN